MFVTFFVTGFKYAYFYCELLGGESPLSISFSRSLIISGETGVHTEGAFLFKSPLSAVERRSSDSQRTASLSAAPSNDGLINQTFGSDDQVLMHFGFILTVVCTKMQSKKNVGVIMVVSGWQWVRIVSHPFF